MIMFLYKIKSTINKALIQRRKMYSNPYYSSTVAVDDSALLSFGVGFIIVYVILGIAFYCVQAFFTARLFKKAGLPEWQGWVPFLAQWKFLEIGGQQGWIVLLLLVPFVGTIVMYVFMCIAAYNIGLKLKKESAYVVLYVFMSIIWLGICGLDKSKWDDSKGKKSLAEK